MLVTNQSAIGRGMLTEDRLDLIHDEMNRQLAAAGAALDAIYYCPEAPAGDDRTVVEHPDRKPGPGMLLRAAAELGLDLGASWMVGDMISDVLAGLNAGCRGASWSGRAGPDRRSPDRMAAETCAPADHWRPGPRGRQPTCDPATIRGARSMKILLTGGAGYIGSACLRWLLRHGHDPIAYDNLSEGNAAAVPDAAARLIVGDIADDRPDGRGAAAASDRGRDALRRPGVGPRLDRRPRRLLPGQRRRDQERARRHATRPASRRIVFSSTAATYGFHAEMPLREDSPQTPETPYGTTKLAAEWLIKDYARAYGLGYTLLRYFNASGADPDGDYGEDRRHESHLIPLIFQVAVGRREKLLIYGDDWETRDGTCVRDYVHTDGPGAGPPARRRGPRAGRGPGLQPRLGDRGRPSSRSSGPARRSSGGRSAHEIVDRRPGDPATLIASPEKIVRELGWSPRYTDIREIAGPPGSGTNATRTVIAGPPDRDRNGPASIAGACARPTKTSRRLSDMALAYLLNWYPQPSQTALGAR